MSTASFGHTPFLYYTANGIDADGAYLEMPVGVKLNLPNVEVQDFREERTLKDFPKFLLGLRPLQKEAYEAWIKDTERGIICKKTGSGKSILALYCAAKLKQKTLIIVHKTDLVIGWQKDIKYCFGDAAGKIGVLQAGKRIVGDFITIASVATIARPEFDLASIKNSFGLVVVDECQRVPSNSFSLLNDFSAPYKIGLSATPERNDGLDRVLHYYFGGFAYSDKKSAQEETNVLPTDVRLISDNQPLEPHYYRMKNEYISEYRFFANGWDYLGYPVSKSDMVAYKDIHKDDRPTLRLEHVECQLFFEHETWAARIFLDKVLSLLKKHLDLGHSCVLFAKQKNYIRLLNEYLIRHGVDESTIQTFYGDSQEKDEVIIARAESKEKLVTIATYAKASEGTNVRTWEVGFALTSVGNGMGIEQVVGRIRRVKEGKISPVIWYDFNHQASYLLSRHLSIRLKRYKEMGLHVMRENDVSK